jgi:crotonobetainyl-CoA:carnitine CoA-transferase CaiB-like acyl-CoA transferase
MIKGAFDGITVLDFTQGIAGPHASMLLALHGADVIKIEPPEGDWGRALGDIKGDHCAHSIAFNRGKRSIALDLKSADGRAVVQKLAAKADVVMESFRPGVIKRLGFGYDDIRKVNPKVVYCSVSGFGQTGPYSKRPTVDGLIQAFSGMMVMNKLPDGTPWRQGMIAVDVTTGLYTFQALAPAIMRQFRFGEGCYIDSSLMKSAAAFQGGKLMEWIFSNGAPPVLYMPAGSYKSKNGYIMVSAMRPHHFKLLFELIGRPDIANDPELQSHEARIKNAPKIIKALQETMPSKTTEEWIAILQPKDVFCERVNNYTDYLEHEHVKESGAIDWIDQDRVGRLPVANIPGLPRAAEHEPQQHAPHIGEDGPDILDELGYSAAEIEAIFTRGGIGRPSEADAAKAAD